MKLSIREAAQKINVETHVLRFWEEELGLIIPRNEMGHRYYGEEEMEILKDIQRLKEKGFSLKAVRILLPETELVNQLDDFGLEILKEELEKRFHDVEEENNIPKIVVQPVHKTEENRESAKEHIKEGSDSAPQDVPAKIKTGISDATVTQFVEILKEIFGNMLEENNREMISRLEEKNQKLSEGILKEMDYRFRMQEEQREQYFKNLDETIRNHQNGGRQVAATAVSGKKRGLFSKKK